MPGRGETDQEGVLSYIPRSIYRRTGLQCRKASLEVAPTTLATHTISLTTLGCYLSVSAWLTYRLEGRRHFSVVYLHKSSNEICTSFVATATDDLCALMTMVNVYCIILSALCYYATIV